MNAFLPRSSTTACQGKYAEAEPLYERVTEIWKHALGPDHPSVAIALHDLAEVLRMQVTAFRTFQEFSFCPYLVLTRFSYAVARGSFRHNKQRQKTEKIA